MRPVDEFTFSREEVRVQLRCAFALVPLLCAACSIVALVAQEPARAAPSVESILARHVAALGGPRAVAGDLELSGTFERAESRWRFRALVRREPFAWREETQAAGEAEPRVFVCDDHNAWFLDKDGKGEALGTSNTLALMENAFLMGLRYAAADRRAFMAVVEPRGPLDSPGIPRAPGQGRRVEVVELATTAGTPWHCWFDAEDGRLHGWDDPFQPSGRWVRVYEWKEHDGLVLPSKLAIGHRVAPQTTTTWHIERVRSGMSHAAELFAGNPAEPGPGVVEASKLVVARTEVPGSGYFVLPEVRINRSPPVAAVLDTGAGHTTIGPRLHQRLGLPPVGRARVLGIFGQGMASILRIETLDLGALSLLQVLANATTLPAHDEPLPEHVIGIVLGGRELWRRAPVLDLQAGALRLRGPQRAPLADVDSGVTIPMRREPRASIFRWIELAVGEQRVVLIFDTGMPYFARLTPQALRRLGLPLQRSAWEARGAMPLALGAVGGANAVELVARFDSAKLGPITYERPWIVLAGLDGGPVVSAHGDGMLGAGALLPFAQIGIDLEGDRLELVPGPEVVRQAGGGFLVRDPGDFLGFELVAGELVPGDPRAGDPRALPRVKQVIPGSRAARAGLREGDRVQSVNGLPCAGRSPSAIYRHLWPREGEVEVTLWQSGGQARVVRV